MKMLKNLVVATRFTDLNSVSYTSSLLVHCSTVVVGLRRNRENWKERYMFDCLIVLFEHRTLRSFALN
jgi:hypothetical protein